MKHVNIEIRGEVQGVFFRAEAKKQAESLGLVGFVNNQDDGGVYIEVEGDTVLIDEFIQWCHEGPILARVEQLRTETEEGLKQFTSFEIRI